MSSFPKVVILDLDGTVWTPDMYMLGAGSPFKKKPGCDFTAVASRGEEVRLCSPDVRDILAMLAQAADRGMTKVCTASTCDEPDWARELLRTFTFKCRSTNTVRPINDVFFHHEIFTAGDKTQHFANIQRMTSCNFSDMIFMDNQQNNIHTAKRLGIHAVYVPNGLNWQNYKEALPVLDE